jgi:hypothetical protein
VLRDSMPAVLASLTATAASSNITNPSMQNITADTFNGDRHLCALQEVSAAAVKPASACPSPCYMCYAGTAQCMDERCGSTQLPSHGYCSASEGAAIQCTCNPGFTASKYCAPSQPAAPTSLVWWQEVLTIAGSAFTILLGIYSARQHLATRLRKRHSHHGPFSVNDSAESPGSSGSSCSCCCSGHKHSFDLRDRFTMTILRGKVRDSAKGQEATALADALRPLLLGSSAESNELFTAAPPHPPCPRRVGRERSREVAVGQSLMMFLSLWDSARPKCIVGHRRWSQHVCVLSMRRLPHMQQ